MSETSTKYTLHYSVLSPKQTPWHRSAGPFASLEAARADLACRRGIVGVVGYRIVRETVTSEVVEEEA